MRLRRTGARGLRGRGSRLRPNNNIQQHFHFSRKDLYSNLQSVKMVKGTSIEKAASEAASMRNHIKEEEEDLSSLREDRLHSLSLKPNLVLEEKNSKLSNKDQIQQIKITSYFSPRITNNGPAILGSSDNLSNGSCTIEDHSQHTKSKCSKVRSKHKAPSSSPTKENKKLANGCLNSESTKPSVCTRSQSQKLLSSATKPNSDWTSPVKDANESTDVNCIRSVTRNLDFSPSQDEEAVTPKDTEMSPHTGPPTPHKIQALNEEKLRFDTPLSASNALSKLKLLSPGKINFTQKPKNKRKLPAANSINHATSVAPATGLKSMDKKSVVTNGALPAKPAMRNTQMTEFFPIRRSHRKPKNTIIQEKQKLIEERILSGKEEGLRIQDFNGKGRGIVTTRHFCKGEMVVEYVGDLIDTKEAKDRDKKYALDTSKGCYMYYFTFQNIQYCIDATEESDYSGRLVNHSRNGNLTTKTVEVNGKPHLVLIAKKDIDEGSEVLYDYGDRSKQALEHHPWLAL